MLQLIVISNGYSQVLLELPEPDYLSKSELVDYLSNAPTINKIENCVFPFDSVEYDKVIAYDINGRHERYMSVNDAFLPNIPLQTPTILKQAALTQKELDFLMSFILENETYGEQSSACFEPSMALIFFKNNEVVFNITICLDCNASYPTIPIPAMEFSKQYFDDGSYYSFGGYSNKGIKKIVKLAKMLSLGYADFKPY